MNKKLVLTFLSLSVLLSGCGAKKREAQVNPVQTPAGKAALPGGFIATEKKLFFIHPSRDTLTNQQENEITFNIVREDLSPVDPAEYEVRFDYDMPEMAMKIVPVREVKTSPGRFVRAFDISMGGFWQIRVSITAKNGAASDKLSLDYQVAE